MDRRVDLVNLLQSKVENSSKEVKELYVESHHDTSDRRENTGQDAVMHKLYESNDELKSLYAKIKFVEIVKAPTNKVICVGSWFECNFNGVKVDALLSTFTELDFLENGIVVLDVNSKVGELLCGNRGEDIILPDVKITNIKI